MRIERKLDIRTKTLKIVIQDMEQRVADIEEKVRRYGGE